MPLAPRHDPQASHHTALVAYMAQSASPGDPDVDVPERRKAASSLELLHRDDFAECTDEERRALARAMRELRLEVARRTSRRWQPAHRGDRLDLPRIVRAAARHGGVPVVLAHRRPKIKPRPVVVIADIWGSMELYARLVLQFLHGLRHRHRPTEVFVFGTRLTRITPSSRCAIPTKRSTVRRMRSTTSAAARGSPTACTSSTSATRGG